ncbi:D-alanine--poly(phosphoribitol) ligase subunit DltA [Companilactobacillus sp.]|jgi:D-alanine--poly(phosphoribitol) ligase subunit 1|uniref:D-alanine--poly(phosphoribitol) ligase subunit DltA n=1 Tax=Companilactobacillus sp. TaxID=2767905 RepID=UPI0025C11904|nr:D-alanine--poly(phosphoribitol) ligase subunit DltA [Companilactobacillus sp.]MCH4010017.1 D-alanine--poly(phosphoribitol) ligase subunit DltA [Companilactobacillus sp.]MCH4052307.1 D-alanine--poly(phosphoribitol) ligase subunit DltA [Companilactobacillus sp.]MCH4077959.1 D-alanine--poly(phosphoribitol) ligase subunit DltA [Companilactobacillus sp.]MCH4126535.1 D-alanine--poly(phosphoribitol) ligase subunit DltA [Companilactobacillus sp.]MCH4132121.1 D-alanine--poly(phosphoribitol) ligase s
MNKIIDRITRIAQTNPDKVCYHNGDVTATYRDLDSQSDKIASFIQEKFLPQGSPIIIFGGQQFEMLVMFLGAIKSGHAYIPVDDGSDSDRIKQINNVAKPSLVLNWSDKDDFGIETTIIAKDELASVMNSDHDTYDATLSVGPDDNFYIIFTSGTTGTPKGVQISTNNLLDFVEWVDAEYKYTSQTHVMLQAPFSFDLSVFSIYPGLTNGSTLEVLDKETAKNLAKLQQAIINTEATTWISTPSFFEMCLFFKDFNSETLPNLKKFIFCGEELTHVTADKLLKRFEGAELYNTYGPTENTVAITSIQITPQILDLFDRLPIGYLKKNMEHKLANVEEKDGEKVGELLVSGPDVSKGYLNNPVQTEKAFESIEGKTFYHTGDMVSENEDGLLFYKGRTDFQIKMHGYRIELEEVDSLLSNLEEVKQSCTVPLYNSKKQVNKIIAHIVLDEKYQDVDEKEMSRQIKEELKQNTMEYMIPNILKFVKQLPISKNGKIDRKALIGEVNA